MSDSIIGIYVGTATVTVDHRITETQLMGALLLETQLSLPDLYPVRKNVRVVFALQITPDLNRCPTATPPTGR